MNRITKKRIVKDMVLSRKTEEELRAMKILTAFKKNIVEYLYRNCKWRARLTNNEAAEKWLCEKLKIINTQSASAAEVIRNSLSWFDPIEGDRYWREKSEEAENLKH